MTERPIIFSADMVRAILDGRKTQTRRVAKYVLDTDMLRGGAYFGKEQQEARCPYGKPGDRLWVREAWRVNGNKHDYARATRDDVYYRADEPWNTEAGWRSPIHMPRWASRLTLEITDVRAERLQDISDDDAIEEGVDRTNTSIPTYATQRFRTLWDSINGKKYPWESNPWVFVIEFRRIP